MKTAVVTISSRRPHERYYHLTEFESSSKRQGISPIFLDASNWGGLITKLKRLKAWIEKEGSAFDQIVSLDSWDTLLLTPISELEYNHRMFGDKIVFNAEASCFPEPQLARQFDVATTPYQYLNSGFLMGSIDAVRQMLVDINPEDVPDDHVQPDGKKWEPNDQLYVQRWYLNHKDKAVLDTTGILCQSLHLSTPDEYAYLPDTHRIVSLRTKNQPCVVHGNGSGKAWLEKMILWLNL